MRGKKYPFCSNLVERVVNASSLQIGGDLIQKSVVLFRIRQRWILVMGLNVCQQRPGKTTITVRIKD